MSVSGGSVSGGDLDLAVQGGPAYTQRLEELADATEKYQKALENLQLGVSARDAYDKASRMLEETKAQRADMLAGVNAEVENARNRMNDWVEATKLRTTAAFDEANAALADARNQQDIAEAAKKSALSALADARKEAASLVQDAKDQAKEVIAKAEKDADGIIGKAKNIDAVARKALSEAEAAKEKYDAAMERIKSAMVD